MINPERGNFGTKLGVILATAGGAVGLGNVWRFPYVTGQNGGAAFILIYIGCVLVMGIPVMLCEMMIGRHAQANTARAYSIMGNGTAWKLVGYLGVLTSALILGYYSVVSGWTLQYIFSSIAGNIHGTPEYFKEYFTAFSTHPVKPIMWGALLIGFTHFVIVHGVQNGIEKASKIMMPQLFVLLIVLVVCSLSLPNSWKGVEFLLKPDFSKVTGKTFLEALGQSFFSLSIAMGCLCTYASYFKRETKLLPSALQIAGIDTQAFGSMPLVEYFVSILFYLLLAIAALTSNISIHEVSTSFLSEELHLGRRNAARLVTLYAVIMGGICSLSLGMWDWCEITNWGTTNVRFVHLFVLAVKYICPLFILFVFFHQLGWI